MPAIVGSFAPTSSDQLDLYEEQLGVSLPSSYRSFLLSTNGGSPEPNLLAVPGCGETLVDFLYGIAGSRESGDLLGEQEQVRDFDQLPPGWIRIGHDPGGNSLLLCTVGERRGQVFYWDSAYFFESTSDEGNTYFVAEDIQAMLCMLQPLQE